MLVIDFETYSGASLPDVGAFRYSMDPTTEVLILGYGRIGEAVRIWTPDQPFPQELQEAVAAGEDLIAHNASFDRAVWENVLIPRYAGPEVKGRWLDSRTLCALLGLPRSLDKVAQALSLVEQKEGAGKDLIRMFSIPPAGKNLFGRVMPADAPEQWAQFIDYCRQDVKTLIDLIQRLEKYLPWLDADHPSWDADYAMNRRGVQCDTALVSGIIQAAENIERSLNQECSELTDGLSPRQVKALLAWLKTQGLELDKLGETEIWSAMNTDLDPTVRRVLELRMEGSKSAWRKAYKALDMVDANGRLHDQLIYASTHTYRWTGRGVQLQNLPRPKLKGYQLESAISVLTRAPDLFPDLFSAPMDALSSVMRSILTASPGNVLGICDYSKIEVCVLAWLAEDRHCVDALHKGEDLYKQLAAKIYNVPESKVTKDQRFTGKSGILGGGYGAGWQAFQASCLKQRTEISEELARATIAAYREKHAPVVRFWRDLELAAMQATIAPGEVFPVGPFLEFTAEDQWLFCRLPSGRRLSWFRPKLHKTADKRGGVKRELVFQGLTKSGDLYRSHTFGGRICENVVSSTARDLLAESLAAAEREGLNPVLTVHDEIVADAPPGVGQALAEIMLRVPEWSPGLPVGVEYQEAFRYGK